MMHVQYYNNAMHVAALASGVKNGPSAKHCTICKFSCVLESIRFDNFAKSADSFFSVARSIFPGGGSTCTKWPAPTKGSGLLPVGLALPHSMQLLSTYCTSCTLTAAPHGNISHAVTATFIACSPRLHMTHSGAQRLQMHFSPHKIKMNRNTHGYAQNGRNI